MLLALLLLVATAEPTSDDVARAKVLYQSGKTHYDLGNYSEAIRDFAAGYALSPKPEFLINLGQAYRAGGEKEKALELYRRYLERAPAGAKPRAEVQALVLALESELAAAAAAAPSPAPAADAPKAEAVVLAPAAAAAPLATVTEAPRAAPSVLWWVVPVAVVVAAGVAAGVGVAVVSSNTVSCGNSGGLGCVDLRPR